MRMPRFDWADAAVTVGACSVVYGAWLIFQPLGPIIGGMMLLYLGIAMER